MSVNDFKIEVYNTAGTGVVSQLYVKTDGNIEAEFALPAADKDLITKEFADTTYAEIIHNHDGDYSPVDHDHDTVYSPIGHNHDGDYAPDVHNHDTLYYQKSEFVYRSDGVTDANKPIILDGNGLISDTMLDVATFIYQGNWTPTAGTEYPSTSGLDIGAFWTIDGLTGDYTFTGGDLAGETISNDDLLIWGTEGWAMTKRDEDLSVYYKLDGSKAITDSFAGGGQQIKNIADATADTDAMTKGQADLAYAPISAGGDFMADGSVPMTGDFDGGDNRLTNIADAIAASDGLTKGQADLAYEPIGGGGGDEYVRIDGTSIMESSLQIKSSGDANTYVLFERDTDGTAKGGVGCIGPEETAGLLLFETDGVTIANYLELTAGGNVKLHNFILPTDDRHLVTKAWVENNATGYSYEKEAMAHFNSHDETLQSSHGVASIEYMDPGKYRMHFGAVTPDVSYYITGSAGGQGAETDSEKFFNVDGDIDQTVASCEFRTVRAADNASQETTKAIYVRVVHPYYAFAASQPESKAIDTDRGAIENPDGSLRTFNAGQGFTMAEAFAIIGEPGHIIPKENCPDTAVLRAAWRFDSVANEIYIDVEKAKEIVIGLNEEKAKRQLKALRSLFEEAYDMDDQTALSLIKDDRNDIRNALAITITNINAATTATEVESYLP